MPRDQVHAPGPGTPHGDQVHPPGTLPGTRYTPRDTATAADGTHPTGMHSCSAHNQIFIFLKATKVNFVTFQLKCTLCVLCSTLVIWQSNTGRVLVEFK